MLCLAWACRNLWHHETVGCLSFFFRGPLSLRDFANPPILPVADVVPTVSDGEQYRPLHHSVRSRGRRTRSVGGSICGLSPEGMLTDTVMLAMMRKRSSSRNGLDDGRRWTRTACGMFNVGLKKDTVLGTTVTPAV